MSIYIIANIYQTGVVESQKKKVLYECILTIQFINSASSTELMKKPCTFTPEGGLPGLHSGAVCTKETAIITTEMNMKNENKEKV